MDLSPSPDETLDSFLDGNLSVLQKKKGHRVTTDALLLSRFARLRKGDRVIDLGTGCAILPLLLARTTEGTSFIGVDIQEEMAELAGRNVKANHLDERIGILCEDFRGLRGCFPPSSFDAVISNPPYRRGRTGRINPGEGKAMARHELAGTLDELASIIFYLLPARGRCFLIFPASRTVDLLSTMRQQRLEPKRLRFVHSRPAEEARFVLVEAIREGGTELRVEAPVFLQTA
jgi:tRNA1Val (adenine37-N6)-methyltransferase